MNAQAHWWAACGKRPMLILISPYPPRADWIPARRVVTGEGAWTYASGSQLWKGTTGSLTPKPMNEASSGRYWRPCGILPTGSGCRTTRRGLTQVAGEEGEQHHSAPGEDEDHELHGSVPPPVAAPDADEEEHRDRHELPEDVEDDQVQRSEDADYRPLEEEQRGEVGRQPLADQPARTDDHEDCQDRRGQDRAES